MTLLRAYLSGLRHGWFILGYTLCVCLTLLITAPFLMIALRSVGKGWFGRLWFPPQLTWEWYRWAIEVGNIPEVMKNTLIIGAIAVIVSTVIGIFAGWAFGRRQMPGKELVMAIVLLPRMIPPITYALGVAKIFYTLELVDTHLGVALAHVSVCAPYAILVLSATFEGLDERVLEAASVCGANTIKRFFYVVLPLIMPGILASMIFSFTHSYNEFTLTLLTYGPNTVTLPVRTYLAVGDGYWEITSAMAVIMVVPSLVILAMIQRRAKPEKLVGGFKGV
ncbi:MAG: binding-protein-dependent transporter inner rane component [candidate division NC10 bacterium]|nr:binding-protein-dependent transporter inner rane component [candidate division NC10 bacterium]